MLIIRIIRSLIKSEDLIDNIGTCLKIEKILTAFFHSLKNVNSLLNFPAVNLCRIRWIKRFFLERFSKVTKGSAYSVEKFSRVMAPLGRTCLLLTDGKRHLFPHTWVSFSLTCNQFRHRKRKYLYGCPLLRVAKVPPNRKFFFVCGFSVWSILWSFSSSFLCH